MPLPQMFAVPQVEAGECFYVLFFTFHVSRITFISPETAASASP